LYRSETHDAEFGNEKDHLIIIFWFGTRFQTNFFLVFQLISKEKSGLKSSKFKDSGKSCDGVRSSDISSFQLSFHDGFGIMDLILTFGSEVETCHKNTNSSSESEPFGL
jgi:hypothetical protein